MRGRVQLLAVVLMIAGCEVTIDSAGPVAGGSPDANTPGNAHGWQPPANMSWQWQLSGTLDMSLDVTMYDVDLFETPQATIDSLRTAGHRVICYVDVGSWEPNRPDSSQFASSVLGSAMVGWPDERWLDIRSASVATLIDARLDLAVSKHCDGVEPDNVDGYANTTGFPLTASDQLAFNRHVAGAAHARGLSVGLKNDLDQVTDLLSDFDWALNEQCFEYGECSQLQPFVAAHKAVFEVEYGSSSLATTVCPQANAANFNTLIKDLNLDSWRVPCR